MIQRFIELGNGYTDVYELFELAERMPERVEKFLAIHSVTKQKTVTSLALIMKETRKGNFQPIYVCLEGIPYSTETPSKRYREFKQIAESNQRELIELSVKHSEAFHEKTLFYQYIIGILKMNRLLNS